MQCLKYQFGFNFLELLIVLTMLGIVIFPIIHLQSISLRETNSALQLSLAARQISNLIERLQVNPSETARQNELNNWRQQLPFYLNQAVGDYQCSNPHACSAKIEWVNVDKNELIINFFL